MYEGGNIPEISTSPSFCRKPKTAQKKKIGFEKFSRWFLIQVVWGKHFKNWVCICIFMYSYRYSYSLSFTIWIWILLALVIAGHGTETSWLTSVLQVPKNMCAKIRDIKLYITCNEGSRFDSKYLFSVQISKKKSCNERFFQKGI